MTKSESSNVIPFPVKRLPPKPIMPVPRSNKVGALSGRQTNELAELCLAHRKSLYGTCGCRMCCYLGKVEKETASQKNTIIDE